MDFDFKKLKDSIQNVIDDVTSLEVVTLTNPIPNASLNLQTDATNKDIFTAVRNNLTQAELVAYTKFEIDGDAINFITKDADLSSLIEKHNTLVDSALATRKALFETIIKTVKEIIK